MQFAWLHDAGVQFAWRGQHRPQLYPLLKPGTGLAVTMGAIRPLSYSQGQLWPL